MTEETKIRIKKAFEKLHENRMHLAAWQLQFIDSLKKQWKNKKELSEKQQKILYDMIWKVAKEII